ncbi:MAG: sulfite exporter TauE/SafE family protein [Chloroflexi bacterium]|nr:sulfite exporter TauE/SafE family protein [Chloroflexota bacterium]
MTLTHILIFLLTGGAVGFASGLLGIGGAFIMTPVQYLVYSGMGLSSDAAIKLAFGTDLMVVLPTAISGAWRHHRIHAVDWKVAVIMGVTSFGASFGAAAIATRLPGTLLKTAFGAIVLLSGVRMFFAPSVPPDQRPRDERWLWIVCAVFIGIVSGLFGVGGGFVTIPIMTVVLRFRLHHAVATSLAMMIFTSFGGVTGYIVNGLGVPGLPAYSIGYVNLLAWLSLTVTSTSMAQVGAITAHHIPAKHLRIIFVILLTYIGLKMLGVFDLLGWPI